MEKIAFTLLVSLMIALQSVVSVAEVSQLHHADEQHHDHHADRSYHECAHGSVNPANDDPEGQPLEKNQDHADHCHHGHSCFHLVLTDKGTDLPHLSGGLPPTDQSLNFTIGIRFTLYRPPIA